MLDSITETLSGPLRDRSNMSADAKLKQIAETDEHSELHEASGNCSDGSNAGSDKENPPIIDVDKRRLRMLSSSRNSTPHHVGPTASQADQLKLQPQQLLPKTSSSVSSCAASQHNDNGYADVRRELSELRDSLEERFGQLERELKWSAQKTTFQIFSQTANYWNQQLENTQEIRDALALLLQTDRFTQEFVRLQHENQVLRAQVEKLQSEQEIEKPADH